MSGPDSSKREAVLDALAILLQSADDHAERLAEAAREPRASYGLEWHTLPRGLLDLSGQLCDHWTADEKIETVRILLRIAAWAVLAAESFPLWPLSAASHESAAGLLRKLNASGKVTP